MTNVFIFHGTGGYPEENWLPWLKGKLEPLGCKVTVPQFPTPEDQTAENWHKVFQEHEKDLNEDTILIGHSLGGVFVLEVLEKSREQIKAAILVASPFYSIDPPFTDHAFDFKKIRENCRKFMVFHSDNDPYVGLENGEKLAKKLETELTLVPNAGHFNASAGYTEFDLLLAKVKEVL